MSRDDPEHRLSHYVDRLLDRILVEPCWYTAVERQAKPQGTTTEQQRLKNMVWQQRLKARGVKPHHLDWYAWQKATGVYTQFELKYGSNDTSGGQDATIGLLQNRGIPTGTFWTLRDVYGHIKSCGFQLHGNADNIFAEEEQRWLAADQAKRAAPATVKKPRASKPRAKKPSQAQVRKLTRLRSQVMF